MPTTPQGAVSLPRRVVWLELLVRAQVFFFFFLQLPGREIELGTKGRLALYPLDHFSISLPFSKSVSFSVEKGYPFRSQMTFVAMNNEK